ncbi:MAG: hypothetical protein CMJ58_13410 [Planctomycetaceae bacterium]|nr:hypothetical protein [Planctomycetaceae bacterium]
MATVDSSYLTAPVIVIPQTRMTIDDFREWVYSEDFPERGRVTYVQGRVTVDMSPERVDLHTKIKGEISFVITGLVKAAGLGEFFPDGAWFTNRDAGVSHEPDAAFASWDTLKSGRLAPPADRANDDRYIELVGAPDWICEIVSDSSVDKDTRQLLDAYHRAGIREYWLIDARGEEINFQLLLHREGGYEPAVANDGWVYSPVFQREFKLSRRRNPLGRWQYDLEHRTSE